MRKLRSGLLRTPWLELPTFGPIAISPLKAPAYSQGRTPVEWPIGTDPAENLGEHSYLWSKHFPKLKLKVEGHGVVYPVIGHFTVELNPCICREGLETYNTKRSLTNCSALIETKESVPRLNSLVSMTAAVYIWPPFSLLTAQDDIKASFHCIL